MGKDKPSPDKDMNFADIFNIDENSIPGTIIEKDPDGPKITEPVLTSDEAQRFLPKEARKALEKEKKAEKKQQKKHKRRSRMIMILSAAVLILVTAGIVNLVITDAKTPTISVEKPIIQTVSRYYTGTAVSITINNTVSAVFIDNDYDVHFIEKGQTVEMTTSENTVIEGTVTDIKEESADSEFLKKYYTVLTGTLPSTPVYAVCVTPTVPSELSDEGITLSAKVITKSSEDALTVPSTAVFINGNQYYVWVYNTFKKTLSKQDVSIGISVDGTTEITKGLEKSDKVAITFSCLQEKLYDGIRVKNR